MADEETCHSRPSGFVPR